MGGFPKNFIGMSRVDRHPKDIPDLKGLPKLFDPPLSLEEKKEEGDQISVILRSIPPQKM